MWHLTLFFMLIFAPSWISSDTISWFPNTVAKCNAVWPTCLRWGQRSREERIVMSTHRVDGKNWDWCSTFTLPPPRWDGGNYWTDGGWEKFRSFRKTHGYHKWTCFYFGLSQFINPHLSAVTNVSITNQLTRSFLSICTSWYISAATASLHPFIIQLWSGDSPS